jgi:nitrogen regulatory protein P-II 1
LIENEITRITVVRVSGHGQQFNEDIYRGKKVVPNLIPKVKLEIAVNDAFVDITVNTIIANARTNSSGEVGDGKIWIIPIEQCIRIRTGEQGGTAI